MSDTLMAIIGIFLGVILMFVLPLTIMANKNDEISQTVVQVAVSDFVDTATKKGKITAFDYDKLIQKLSATGNSYDVQIEAQIIDDNPRRAATTLAREQTGEFKYYSVYTNTILEEVDNNGEYPLKKDDYLIVNVKNTNITLATSLKSIFYRLIGNETYAIGTSSSALVVNDNTAVVEPEAIGNIPEKPNYVTKEVTIYISNINRISSNITFILDITGSMSSTTDANGYKNRMDMVRSNVKSFLQQIEMPEESDPDNPIINLIRFGTISEIMTPTGITTKDELNTFLEGEYMEKVVHTNSRFSGYENYDLGLEDGLKCVRRNKLVNSKPNVVIVITDGQHAYNSTYCTTHNGNMSEYAKKFITDEGATVFAVGIKSSTDVLNSMVLDRDNYTVQISGGVTLTSVLKDIKKEIITEEQKRVVAVNGKILLEDVNEISSSKPLKIKITGPIEQELVITSPSNAMIEKIGANYWLDLLGVASKIGGIEVMDSCNLGIYY